jgi:hypothetical protein
LSGIGTEGVVGGVYRRVGVLGCGVVVMEQVPRGSRRDKGRGPDGGGGAVKGGVGRWLEAKHMRGGTGEWWSR